MGEISRVNLRIAWPPSRGNSAGGSRNTRPENLAGRGKRATRVLALQPLEDRFLLSLSPLSDFSGLRWFSEGAESAFAASSVAGEGPSALGGEALGVASPIAITTGQRPVDPRWFRELVFSHSTSAIGQGQDRLSGEGPAESGRHATDPGLRGWGDSSHGATGTVEGQTGIGLVAAAAGRPEHGWPNAAGAQFSGEPHAAGQEGKAGRAWIITLAEAVSARLTQLEDATRLLTLDELGASRVVGLGQAGVLLVEWPSIELATRGIVALRDRPEVVAIEPNGYLIPALFPNDPLFEEQWALHNVGRGNFSPDADIDAPEAWDHRVDASSTIVAIVDTGIDYRHPDLVANMWVNPREIPGNGRDDDGNGFVDDVYGYDFANNDGDPWDDHGHGTHVAGIVGAVGNNGRGVTGVAWRASLMAVKFLGADGVGSVADAVRAINYVTMMRTSFGVNVRVINASWGSEAPSEALERAIQNAGAAGILFVAAAGNGSRNNDSAPHYPSNFNLPNLVAVAASDQRDQLASFSNFGRQRVHLAAPGVDILSTYPGERYARLSGTSMAAPFVSGAVALAWAAAPNASLADIRQALGDGVDRLPGWGALVAFGGRLNARGTLQALSFRVLTSLPAEGQAVAEPPRVFRLGFSGPVDASSLWPGGFRVNGQPASACRLVGSTEVEYSFHASPVSSQGPQVMELEEGAVRQVGSARGVAGWQAVFYYDVLPGAVLTTDPPSGATLVFPPSQLVVTWNEPVASSSVGVDDLLLSDGTVVQAVIAAPHQIIYTLSDLPRDGTVEFRLAEGAVVDSYGNPMAGYFGRWTIRDPQLLRYRATDLPQAIQDWQWTRSQIVVPEAVAIADLDVAMTIEHTFTADLDVYLVGPDGTRILLFADVGGSGRNFNNTILDDEAPLPITQGTAPFRGRFRPAEPLGRFVGRSSQGTWKLEIYDDSLFDQGQLLDWELRIRHNGQLAPYVLAVLPEPEGGGEILESVNKLEIIFSSGITVDLSGGMSVVELTEAGSDGVWGSADDRTFGVEIFWSTHAPDRVTLLPHAGRLPPGEYRLRLNAAAVTNSGGVPLDGDRDGQPGGDWIFPFRILPAQFYRSSGEPLPIRDLQSVVSEILVPHDFVLSDVDVFLDIEHTFTADLDIYLVAPDGTRVELLTDVGGAGDHFRRTILDDAAPTPITQGEAPFPGHYRPEGSLGVLNGKSAAGLWQLHIYDDSRRDEGMLLAWGLVLAGLAHEAPRLAGFTSEINGSDALEAICLTFTQPMDQDSFSIAEDVLLFRGPAGNIPIVEASWPQPHVLRLAFPPQNMRGEYRLRLSPRISSHLGYYLDVDGDGVPGELPDDLIELAVPLPVALGEVSLNRWTIPLGPDGILWASVQNTRPGVVTLLADAGTPLPIRLAVYENPFAPPVWAGDRPQIVRTDIQAPAAGRTWYFRVEAASATVNLAVANVLEVGPAGIVTIHGTEEDDAVFANVGSGVFTLGWNGIDYEIAATRVHLLGYGGVDRLELSWSEEVQIEVDPFGGYVQTAGIAAGEAVARRDGLQGALPVLSWDSWENVQVWAERGDAQVVAFPFLRAQAAVVGSRFELAAADYSLRLNGLRKITVDARGTDFAVSLRGGPGDDQLLARPGLITWQSGGLSVDFRGVATLDAFAGAGGTDLANLLGSQGDDVLTVGASSATLVGPQYTFRVGGFTVTSFYPGEGANDLARVYDVPTDDSYTITPHYVSFSRGPTFYRIFAFPRVSLCSDAGGLDSVRLYDSPDDDILWCSPTYFRWAGSGWEVRGSGFERITAFSSAGGKDRATLVGSGGQETLRVQGGIVRLSSGTFQLQTTSFFQVAVYGSGGNDRATIYDSPGDDSLVATPRYTTLVGPRYELRVYDFSEVQAFSTAGGKDVARLYPEETATTVTLTPSYGVLQGSGLLSRAWGFSSVLAYAPANQPSSARLYGTEAAERLEVDGSTVGLFGQGWRRYAVGFRDVSVNLQGGANRAEVFLPAEPAQVVINGPALEITLPHARFQAWGLENIHIRARKGAEHRAVLSGTAGVDLLEAHPAFVRLRALESPYAVELFDFSFVEARSSGTIDRRALAEGVDYVLTIGDWMDYS